MKFLNLLKTRIDTASKIIISTHLFPDADGIGSQIGLCMALRSLGKDAICVNEEPLLERYKYLDPHDVVIGLDQISKAELLKTDLFIVVDTNNITRIGPNIGEVVKSNKKAQVLFIDHHPTTEKVHEEHCIDTSSAATGQMVGEIIQELGVAFTKEIALPLYTAILIDTSSFRYPTVSASTHMLISKLIETGIEPPDAYNGIYGTKQICHMHLLGEILQSAHSSKSNQVCWISLRKEVLDKYKTDIEDTHAFINHLLVLENIKVAVMFREDAREVKVSLRSLGYVDVGVIAKKLGGGGHNHSAATVIPYDGKTFEDISTEVIKKIESLLPKKQ